MTKRKTTLVTTLVLAVLMAALTLAPAALAAQEPQPGKSLEEQMDFLEAPYKSRGRAVL